MRILETAIYVNDLEAAEKFYKDVIGLELNSKNEGRHLFFKTDSGMLLVFNPKVTKHKTGPVPTHGMSGQGHVAFAVDESEHEGWRQKLKAAGIDIETEVDWPEGGHSIYFRDPSGNSIELASPNIWD